MCPTMAEGNGVVTITMIGLVSAGEDDIMPGSKVETSGPLDGTSACDVSVSIVPSDAVCKSVPVVPTMTAVEALSSTILGAGRSLSGLSRV